MLPSHSPSGEPYINIWKVASNCWQKEAALRPSMKSVHGRLCPPALERATEPKEAIQPGIPMDPSPAENRAVQQWHLEPPLQQQRSDILVQSPPFHGRKLKSVLHYPKAIAFFRNAFRSQPPRPQRRSPQMRTVQQQHIAAPPQYKRSDTLVQTPPLYVPKQQSVSPYPQSGPVYDMASRQPSRSSKRSGASHDVPVRHGASPVGGLRREVAPSETVRRRTPVGYNSAVDDERFSSVRMPDLRVRCWTVD